MGHALDRRATRAAHFNGVVQLALGVDRFKGVLELPETWEIGGATRPRAHLEPICLRQSIQASMASICTSNGHPIGALGVSGHPILQKISINAISPGNATRRV